MSQGLCVFSRRYCSNEVKTLQLKESAFSWTGDDFKVKVDGKTRFKIDGKAFSYRERKVLYDTKTSKAVFTAKDTVLSLHRGIKIQKGTNGKTLFTIGKKKRWIHRHESKMKTRVKDKLSGKRHKIVVKGSWRTKDAVMYMGSARHGARAICTVHRKTTVKNWVTGADDYFLTVEPKVDRVFCVAMCVALDEFYRESDSEGLIRKNKH